jgi:NarL family two-component system response regulator LiaR
MRTAAQEFLLKDLESEQLFGAIRAASFGQATLHPSIAARLLQKPGGHDDDPPADLSPRELEVLRLIARGLSNKEIAEEMTLAEGTVKNGAD